jgi:hypothetical protein
MAMNASGIRDTARVLHVSPTTVIKELKKRFCRKFAFSGVLGAVSHCIADTRFWDFAPKTEICDRTVQTAL